jgi:hypothetical protein
MYAILTKLDSNRHVAAHSDPRALLGEAHLCTYGGGLF